MKKYLKWIAIIIGLIAAIVPVMFLSPLLLPVSGLALWFFSKKRPNEKFKIYARNGLITSVVGFGLLMAVPTADNETNQAVEEELVVDVEAEKTEVEKNKQLQEESDKRQKEELQRQQFQEYKKTKQEKKQRETELSEANPNKTGRSVAFKEVIEVDDGELDVDVNDNIPYFDNDDITSTDTYHRNGPLDDLGRVTAANSLLGVEIMPAEQRGSIDQHQPTGWSQASYANIGAGGWLYNRSHLIGHQLTGNDDFANLMTGTRQFNMQMLEYENFVANYVEQTENHVRYRVTPVFEGNNLVASGAYMEGFSIEDNGEGIMFNVYVPNVQDGVEINYANGTSVGPAGPSQEGEIAQYNPPKEKESSKKESKPAPAPAPKAESKPAPAPKPEPTPPPAPTPAAGEYVDENGNGLIKGSKSDIYHIPGSTYYNKTKNVKQWFKTTAEAEAAGFRAPKR